VLIDGRSGAGKTSLSAELEQRHPLARVLHLEEVYPGWDGLDAASETLVRSVLLPLRAGRPGRYRRWDWAADRPGPLATVPPSPLLIVEGVGALSRASRRLADLAIWVELDDETRMTRAMARDGAAYAPHWERWARQERRFIGRERPRLLADRIVRGGVYPQPSSCSCSSSMP